METKILNKGFVRLVDHMGSDKRIVQAARVSYGAGTKTVREDRALIRYLLRNAHTSPFEQVVFTFHLKMPIFVARQWVRHRTARLNEISARYSIMQDEFYVPDGEDINIQSKDNKQARSEEQLSQEIQQNVQNTITENNTQSYKSYMTLIDKKIAREIARVTLPTSLYTQMYWQIDLHNLFHFLRLRMDDHAQKEIRVYADALFEIIRQICPIACEAFVDYILSKVEFYKVEQKVLAHIIEESNLNEMQIRAIAKKIGISNEKECNRLLQKILKILQ